MATGTEAYDDSTGGATTIKSPDKARYFALTKRMDAAAIIAADATLTAAAKIAAGQEITAFAFPVGTLIFGTRQKIVTASTDTTPTINVGTYADTTAFDAAVSISAAAGTQTISATDAGAIASGGTLITATTNSANKVCVEYIADTTDGSFDLTVFGIDLTAGDVDV